MALWYLHTCKTFWYACFQSCSKIGSRVERFRVPTNHVSNTVAPPRNYGLLSFPQCLVSVQNACSRCFLCEQKPKANCGKLKLAYVHYFRQLFLDRRLENVSWILVLPLHKGKWTVFVSGAWKSHQSFVHLDSCTMWNVLCTPPKPLDKTTFFTLFLTCSALLRVGEVNYGIWCLTNRFQMQKSLTKH